MVNVVDGQEYFFTEKIATLLKTREELKNHGTVQFEVTQIA